MAWKAPTGANPSVRLGVSLLSWVNEVIPEFGADTRAETILGEAVAAGYAGVETSRAFPSSPHELARLLSAHGLSLASGWHDGFLADRSVEEELHAVAAHAEKLRACGANVMVYGECGRMDPAALDRPLSSRTLLGSDEWSAYGDRLTRFATALQSHYGLALAYHHHLGMVAETLDEVRAVMSATGPSVGLLLDTGHAFAAGYDYAILIEEFGPRIRHIHLKDIRDDILGQVRNGDLSFNQAVRQGMFTIPGDGAIDFGPLARFVARSGYRGWMIVEAEQDPSVALPAQTVARAHRFVSETILSPATAGV